MPTGLPDYQTPVNIAAQTLANLSVDIAAQTLATLGVNIKAQDLASIAIDIAAQTLSELAIKTTGATKVAVDVAAQTLSSLDINITAQDLAELVIKIAAQSVGVYIQPEWAALQGIDKNLSGNGPIASGSALIVVDYTVPAGKTLFINHLGLSLFDGAGNLHALLRNFTTSVDLAVTGGAQGCFASLPKPVAITAGQRVVLYGIHFGGGTLILYGHLGGYEI